MKSQLRTKLARVMRNAGYTFDDVNMLNYSPADPMHIGNLLERTFLCYENDEIVDKIVDIKNKIINDVYEISSCPFEAITGVSWERMFRKTVMSPHENDMQKHPFKFICPWFHLAISSAVHKNHQFLYVGKSERTLCTIEFEDVGCEMVELEGTRFTYGEAKIVVRPGVLTKNGLQMYIIQPSFLIDERLIHSFCAQPEYQQVFECLYALYFISSHDGMIHQLFLEPEPLIRTCFSNDSSVSGLLERFGMYDLFEMNYARLMKRIVEYACEQKKSLEWEIINLYKEIIRMTTTWPSLLKRYICFVAYERLVRLVYRAPNEIYIRLLSPCSSPSDERIIPMKEYINHFIHDPAVSEALVFSTEGNGVEEILYATMTKKMFEIYC